jgi:hypothetical protein
MKRRMQVALEFAAARLSEQSTWQGICFIASASGAKWAAGLDWGPAVGVGSLLSAFLKIVFPDPVK